MSNVCCIILYVQNQFLDRKTITVNISFVGCNKKTVMKCDRKSDTVQLAEHSNVRKVHNNNCFMVRQIMASIKVVIQCAVFLSPAKTALHMLSMFLSTR